MCITVAFNLDEVFQKVIQEENDVLRYIVKDDNLGDTEIIGQDRDVLFASGGYFGYNSLFNFLKERGNPLNSNDYIHNKFMLIDPLGEDPIVVTGKKIFTGEFGADMKVALVNDGPVTIIIDSKK